MRPGWRSTLHGEWVLDGGAIVARLRGGGWYAHLMGTQAALGPYSSVERAAEAVEDALRLSRPDSADAGG